MMFLLAQHTAYLELGFRQLCRIPAYHCAPLFVRVTVIKESGKLSGTMPLLAVVPTACVHYA
jgi:hypothetical protein